MANEKANKVTFEQEAKIYEEKALAEIKKISGNGSEEPPEIACILQSGRRAIYMARQELASRVEVVHGRWEEWWPGISLIMTGEEKLYKCSACDAKYADIEGYKHCPYCGADMRGTEE